MSNRSHLGQRAKKNNFVYILLNLIFGHDKRATLNYWQNNKIADKAQVFEVHSFLIRTRSCKTVEAVN